MNEENLEGKLNRKREEIRLKSINIQTKKNDQWNDSEYLKEHLSSIDTVIVVPRMIKNIDFSIEITPRGKLVLAPGTQLKFLNNNQLYCTGQLIADGKSGNEIQFIGRYNKISLNDCPRESSLKYCIFTNSNHKQDAKEYSGTGHAIDISDSPIIMENCKIYNNNNGTGMNIRGSKIDLKHNKIFQNKGYDLEVGGIDISSCRGSMIGNEIYKNHSGFRGGGIAIYYSDLEFHNNHIHNNEARDEKSHGLTRAGGILIHESHLSGNNNIIERNSASESGGGIYMSGSSSFLGKSNIVRLNNAANDAGIFNEYGRSETNCKVYLNRNSKTYFVWPWK